MLGHPRGAADRPRSYERCFEDCVGGFVSVLISLVCLFGLLDALFRGPRRLPSRFRADVGQACPERVNIGELSGQGESCIGGRAPVNNANLSFRDDPGLGWEPPQCVFLRAVGVCGDYTKRTGQANTLDGHILILLCHCSGPS